METIDYIEPMERADDLEALLEAYDNFCEAETQDFVMVKFKNPWYNKEDADAFIKEVKAAPRIDVHEIFIH